MPRKNTLLIKQRDVDASEQNQRESTDINSPEFPIHSYLAQFHILFSLKQHGIALALTKTKWEKNNENLIENHELARGKLGQQSHANKWFPVHRKC